MRRLLLGTAMSVPVVLCTALGIGPSCAQGVNARNWSGPYIGAQVGYGFGDTESVTTNLVGTYPVPFDYESGGVLGGVHAGYNIQYGALVLGVEGDVEAAGVNDRQLVDLYAVTYGSETTLDFGASIRARAGLAFNRLLVFATAGVAWGRVKIEYSCGGCVSAAGATSTLDEVRSGWTAGGGAEYSLTDTASVSLEYRHTDLGSDRLIDTVQVADYHGNRFSYDAVRLGFSYRFAP